MTEEQKDKIKESEIAAAIKYPNMCKLGDDNVLEFYCDNQTLSTLRSCPGYFQESFINELEPKSFTGYVGDFKLDLGSWFHSVMEKIDKAILNGSALSDTEVLFTAKQLWFSSNLDRFKDTKDFDDFGGFANALEMVKDYIEIFQPAQKSARIIATELVFGYDKEAPINDWVNPEDNEGTYPYRAYLIGRPDGIIETQLGIGPKDFKTSSNMNNVVNMYKPSEQLMGYVYGVNKIFGKSIEFKGKKCNTAYLIAVSKKAVKNPKDRVRSIPYTYSDHELEQYRLRQIATFDLVYEQVVLGATAFWDTSKCTNWYFKICPFHKLHSLDSAQRSQVIEAYYKKKEPWNPKTRGQAE